ncbi:MAG: hypothetical protein ABSG85_04705 [Spirochaetia bacterium]
MKMRKLLPLVLLAVGALFLLSGCDAMLDAIFPTNQIYVDVAINKASYPNDWFNTWHFGSYPGTVTLQLYDVKSGSFTTATGSWMSVDYNYIHFAFVFTKLNDDTFELTANYLSVNYGPSGPNPIFYDPSGIRMGFPVSSVSMPYKNSGDSTGHSVNLYMYFY